MRRLRFGPSSCSSSSDEFERLTLICEFEVSFKLYSFFSWISSSFLIFAWAIFNVYCFFRWDTKVCALLKGNFSAGFFRDDFISTFLRFVSRWLAWFESFSTFFLVSVLWREGCDFYDPWTELLCESFIVESSRLILKRIVGLFDYCDFACYLRALNFFFLSLELDLLLSSSCCLLAPPRALTLADSFASPWRLRLLRRAPLLVACFLGGDQEIVMVCLAFRFRENIGMDLGS